MTDRVKHHITKDGSSTFYSEHFQQFYHNPNGSVSESKHVFFETSELIEDLKENKPITIFEVGFGTGLNLFLLMDYYLKTESKSSVHFYSVEAFPLSEEQAQHINFSDFSDFEELHEVLPKVFGDLNSGWNTFNPISSLSVSLHLFKGLFNELECVDHKVDYIFHDAFSPEVNEELWSAETFSKLKSFSSQKAVLTTYGAASKARAAMAVGGWKLAKARGALGKREMTIASLSEEKLTGFKRVNEDRLIERYEAGDFEG